MTCDPHKSNGTSVLRQVTNQLITLVICGYNILHYKFYFILIQKNNYSTKMGGLVWMSSIRVSNVYQCWG